MSSRSLAREIPRERSAVFFVGQKVHVYYVRDLAAVLERLRVHFGTDFLPLANNVQKR